MKDVFNCEKCILPLYRKEKLPKQKLHLDESYNFIVDGFLFKIIYYYKIL